MHLPKSGKQIKEGDILKMEERVLKSHRVKRKGRRGIKENKWCY